MRISDWSSDVCSSDLLHRRAVRQRVADPDARGIAARGTVGKCGLAAQVAVVHEEAPGCSAGGPGGGFRSENGPFRYGQYGKGGMTALAASSPATCLPFRFQPPPARPHGPPPALPVGEPA